MKNCPAFVDVIDERLTRRAEASREREQKKLGLYVMCAIAWEAVFLNIILELVFPFCWLT